MNAEISGTLRARLLGFYESYNTGISVRMNAEISGTIQATILGLACIFLRFLRCVMQIPKIQGMQIPEIPASAHSNAHKPPPTLTPTNRPNCGSYSFDAPVAPTIFTLDCAPKALVLE